MRSKKWMLIMLLCLPCSLYASSFDLPKRGDDLVGAVTNYVVKKGDDFVKIAEKFDVGYYTLIEANPGIDPKKPPLNSLIIVPAQYILPNTPREDVVINLAEMRLYFYPRNEKKVYTYPVGIGREGTMTPLGYMHIVSHRKNPTWHAPQSVIDARAKDGIKVPKIIKPGPDNPLGKYAMRLSHLTYLIHGTNDNSGVGRRSSSGCIRMYPQDIEELFYKVKNGANVLVINEPFKVGRLENKIFLEAHYPLHENENDADLPQLKRFMRTALRGVVHRYQQHVDWNKVLIIAQEMQGLPEEVGTVHT